MDKGCRMSGQCIPASFTQKIAAAVIKDKNGVAPSLTPGAAGSKYVVGGQVVDMNAVNLPDGMSAKDGINVLAKDEKKLNAFCSASDAIEAGKIIDPATTPAPMSP